MELNKIKVAIVDDHSTTRKGIRYVLNLYSDVEVVFEASSAEEALDLMNISNTEVDIILMDIDMPGMGGVVATQVLKRDFPNCAVIFLTGHMRYSRAGLSAGGRGYILKDDSDDVIISAIRHIFAGGVFMSEEVKDEIILNERINLTKREFDMLNDIKDGLTNAQIARKRSLSVDTVKEYVRSLISKLDAKNRTQAIVNAIRMGIITSTSTNDQR